MNDEKPENVEHKHVYVIKEEDRKVGSLLGVVSREDKDLYEEFKKRALSEGLKPKEAIIEAMQDWLMKKEFKNVTPSDAVTVELLSVYSLMSLLSLGKLFVDEFINISYELALKWAIMWRDLRHKLSQLNEEEQDSESRSEPKSEPEPDAESLLKLVHSGICYAFAGAVARAYVMSLFSPSLNPKI